jgi:hypothetical protein
VPSWLCKHDVVVVEDGLEVLCLVVDGDVCAEAFDQLDVGGAGGRGHGGSEVLGQLDGERAHAARPGLDEDLLSGLQVGSFDECPPCR